MPKLKLDKEDIKTIKELCNTTNLLDREIAVMFGVSRKHINSIRNEKRWNYDFGQETNQSIKETIEGYFKKYGALLYR